MESDATENILASACAPSEPLLLDGLLSESSPMPSDHDIDCRDSPGKGVDNEIYSIETNTNDGEIVRESMANRTSETSPIHIGNCTDYYKAADDEMLVSPLSPNTCVSCSEDQSAGKQSHDNCGESKAHEEAQHLINEFFRPAVLESGQDNGIGESQKNMASSIVDIEAEMSCPGDKDASSQSDQGELRNCIEHQKDITGMAILDSSRDREVEYAIDLGLIDGATEPVEESERPTPTNIPKEKAGTEITEERARIFAEVADSKKRISEHLAEVSRLERHVQSLGVRLEELDSVVRISPGPTL